MNFKACCGLLGGKDDEDHDYEDVEQEPLPKPQRAADLRKKVRQPCKAPQSSPIMEIYRLPPGKVVARLLFVLKHR